MDEDEFKQTYVEPAKPTEPAPEVTTVTESRLDKMEARWDRLLDVLKRTGMLHDQHLDELRKY